jgi:uncharacterized membrane protein YebE (DUF533 family)
MSEAQQPRPQGGAREGPEERGPSANAQKGIASTAEEPRPQPGAPPEHDETIVQVLASKVLGDWLRNRQQLLVPFTLDLQKLDPPQVDVLVHAMVAAAYAGGSLVEKSGERLDAALERLNANEAQRDALYEALNRPRALSDTLANVRDVATGAMVYSAALLAIDRRRLVNRHFMRYLAARLDLSPQLARSLEQRFRPAV